MKKKNELNRKKSVDTAESSDEYALPTQTATNTTAITVTSNGNHRPADPGETVDRNTPRIAEAVEPDTGQEGSTIDETQASETDLRQALLGPGGFDDRSTTPDNTQIATRIESLERAVQNLIQYTEASRTIPNGQQASNSLGGWGDTINNIAGVLNKLLGSGGAEGPESLSAKLLQSEIDFNQAVKFQLLKNLGITPPAEHMIIRQ